MNDKQYNDVLNNLKCIYDQKQIYVALDKMADEMNKKLRGKDCLFFCVMNGAVITMGQLLPRLDFPLKVDYIHTSRYRGKTKGGELYWLAKPHFDLNKRCVVLIEDIIDTGITLAKIKDYCFKAGASEVYTAALIDKPEARDTDGVQAVDFHSLQVPNQYAVGFGLDFEEYFRNLPGIYVIFGK